MICNMPCVNELESLPAADTCCKTMCGFGAMQGRVVSLRAMHSWNVVCSMQQFHAYSYAG